MRKFLIKYGVGTYWWKLPDKALLILKKGAATTNFRKLWYSLLLFFRLHQTHYNVTSRYGFWCYNVWFATALPGIILSWVTDNPEKYLSYLWIYIPISVLTLYFGSPLRFGRLKKGLGYFERFPIHWEELDEHQRWTYGKALNSGELVGKPSLSPEYLPEWLALDARFRKKYRLV